MNSWVLSKILPPDIIGVIGEFIPIPSKTTYSYLPSHNCLFGMSWDACDDMNEWTEFLVPLIGNGSKKPLRFPFYIW